MWIKILWFYRYPAKKKWYLIFRFLIYFWYADFLLKFCNKLYKTTLRYENNYWIHTHVSVFNLFIQN